MSFDAPPFGTMPFTAPESYLGTVRDAGEPDADSLCFAFQQTLLLVADGAAGAQLPAHEHLARLGAEPLRRLYLGTLGERACYAFEFPVDTPVPQDMAWKGLRALYAKLDDSLFALAGRALQYVDWDRTHQFCGRCGTPTRQREHERARECPECKLIAYPRIAPAVMCLVRRGREILLARSPHFLPGMYSALAGFVEPGESLEQCLAREVLEETGIRIANARYFASQPWPFPHSLMIAFVADYAGGEITPAPDEIEDAQWFALDALPKLPNRISIARRLIDGVMAEMTAAFRQE
ncbi:MAG: NAD(+) diphosphatase [Proteobacteria bacterium]|nr:NAD(+) diphosphatase [Pseudomonadota bacterium]